jgi:hypothetical protein
MSWFVLMEPNSGSTTALKVITHVRWIEYRCQWYSLIWSNDVSPTQPELWDNLLQNRVQMQ